MTRSAWHCYWMMLTGFAGLACVLCVLAAAGTGRAPGADVIAAYNPSLNVLYARLASDLAGLFAWLWAFVGINAGPAWAAFGFALRG